MDTYSNRTYGDRIAEVYDKYHANYDPAAVAALKTLAGTGHALELGIGTGRVALPLQAAGVSVQGIDTSEAMLSRLASKPGGGAIPVTVGDFADVSVEGQFTLIYVLFNTFFGLLTQADQVRCFRNVASHLSPDGVFVLEAFVPDLGRFRGGQDVRALAQDDNEIRLDVSQIDSAKQLVTSTFVILSRTGPQFYPVRLRYAWPAELDLMAELAGLRLKERWGHWDQTPFTQTSRGHISVYCMV